MDTEHLAEDLVQRGVDTVLERVWKLRASHHAARLQLARRARKVGRAQAFPSLKEVLARREAEEAERQRAMASVGRARRSRHPLDLFGDPDVREGSTFAPGSGVGDGDLSPRAGFQLGLGINAMKAYEWDDGMLWTETPTLTYGAGLFGLQDGARVGVSPVRQFGPRDLRWDLLVNWNGQARTVPFPADPADIWDMVLEGPRPDLATNVQRFADLLAGAWRARVKLRFTFLTLGGGTEFLVETADSASPDSIDGDLPASALTTTTVPASVRQVNVLRHYWTEAALDAYEDELHRDHVFLTGEERAFFLCSLDVSNSYKRRFIGAFARACAELLVQAEAAVRGGALLSPYDVPLSEHERAVFSLDHVLDGIELFNEVDIRNVVLREERGVPDSPAPAESGRMWGGAWVYAAVGFLQVFQTRRAAGSVLPTLYLPGLASTSAPDVPGDLDEYLPTPPGGQWNFKTIFLDAMVTRIREVWATLRGETAPDFATVPLVDLPPLEEVLGGIDYHWYHHKLRGTSSDGETESLGVLHSGWLMTEVVLLREILESHGLDGRISVFESGTTGLVSSGEPASPYQVTEGLPPGDGIGEEQALAFQAQEIWRRLLAAKAGGADQIGWHAWMSASDHYAGFGVRTDSRTTRTPALDSTARPAWFAFHRLSALVRDAAEVRLVRPSTLPSRAHLDLLVPSSGITGAGVFPDVLVFEISGFLLDELGGVDLRGYSYAYVVLVDPTAPTGVSWPVPVAAPPGSSPEPLRLEPFTRRPKDWAELVPEAIVSDRELYAVWLLRYRAWASILAPEPFPLASSETSTVEVSRGGDPIVLLSRAPLAWPGPVE